jgi:DNA invertase Pin-like site-specific DNA recombinase
MRTYTFTVAIPPAPLLPNGRAAWQVKAAVAKKYSAEVGESINAQLLAAGLGGWAPARNARLIAKFYCRGQAPDPDNRVAILKPIIDVLQVANARSRSRYRLGLIEDDRRLEVAPVSAQSYARGVSESIIECRLEVWA